MRAASAPALAAALILGLAGACSNPSTALPASPSPTAVSDYGPPPAGVPLLYVHDPKQASWLIGFDWSGKPRGTVKLVVSAPLQQAPDGSAFETGTPIKGGAQGFLDRLGQSIAAPSGAGSTVREMWADDSSHMCLVTLDPQTFTWGLSTIRLGQPALPVAVLARDQGIGQSGIDLVACSFKHDVAILVRSTIAWPAEEWVVRFSDGLVLVHRQYVFQQLASVVGSPDGAYVAENSVLSSPLSSPPTTAAAQTVISTSPGGTVAGSLDSKLAVLGFSGDDSRVLVESLLNPSVPHLEVVDWKAGRVVWQKDAPHSLRGWLANPSGGDFAVALAGAGPVPTDCPDAELLVCGVPADIEIVHPDGTTTRIGQYEPVW